MRVRQVRDTNYLLHGREPGSHRLRAREYVLMIQLDSLSISSRSRRITENIVILTTTMLQLLLDILHFRNKCIKVHQLNILCGRIFAVLFQSLFIRPHADEGTDSLTKTSLFH